MLDAGGAHVHDMEQLVVRERLTLNILIGVNGSTGVLKDLLFWGWESEVDVDFEVVEDASTRAAKPRTVVTVLGPTLTGRAGWRRRRAWPAAAATSTASCDCRATRSCPTS